MKTNSDSLHSGEPSGTTFIQAGTKAPTFKRGQTTSQKKPKINGEVITHAVGPTRTYNKSFINVPNAAKTPGMTKVVASSSGQGEYEPENARRQAKEHFASGGAGETYTLAKTYEKSGAHMRTSHGWKE